MSLSDQILSLSAAMFSTLTERQGADLSMHIVPHVRKLVFTQDIPVVYLSNN
jgi:hypothetical protein